LASLKTSVAALNSQDSLLKKSATIADKNSNWTATATKDTPAGDYNVEMISQATASVLKGASGLGASIDPAFPISQTWMGATLDPGKFTLNGNTITISSTTTWSQLIGGINAIPSYSANIINDKFVISGPEAINLGSDASDPTNFLQLARLFNNGTNTVSTDSGGLGKLRLDVPLNSIAANFSNTSTWASQGAGSIKVNGQAINIANGMTGQEVLDAITSSSAGVTASYDFVNNSISLRNKNLGNSSIDVQDVSGSSYANLLKITSASNPTLINGQNTSFRINGGGIIQSQGNTITENEHGIKGLVITANSLSSAGSSSVASTSASSLFLDANGTTTETPSAANEHILRFPLNTSGISVGQVVTGSGIPNGTSVVSVLSDSNGYYAVGLSSISGSVIPSGTPITFTNSYTPTKITVAGDTSAAKDALNDFVAKYNDVQNTIEKYTKVTTTGGKVTSSILSGNTELSSISRKLRAELTKSSGLSGTINRLSDLGVSSSGIQNTISFNSSVLESKLASVTDDVTNFFKDTNTTTGFMARFKTNFLDKLVTDAGSATGGLQAQLNTITKQNTSLDKQIAEVETRLASQRSLLEGSFIAMEKAQSQYQQQGAYLAKTYSSK
jgi:flagellar hook-associated protein 2